MVDFIRMANFKGIMDMIPMMDLTKIFSHSISSPVSIGIFTASITMLYLILMSINSYLPPILLLSYTVGYIVYSVQKNCQNPNYNPAAIYNQRYNQLPTTTSYNKTYHQPASYNQTSSYRQPITTSYNKTSPQSSVYNRTSIMYDQSPYNKK